MQIDQNIEILDSTLREGEQTPGVSFSIREKIVLAKKLDLFGVDFIELGHPAVSSDVYEAVEMLNDLELNAKKMVHGRAMKSDINDASAIGVEWMGIFYGTSPISLKHKFNIDQKKALNRIESAIKYGKDQGLKLRFTAEDASRTEISFLIKIGQLAQLAGADRFSIADTVGCLTPTKTKILIDAITKELDIPLHIHCHNDYGMATANAISALESGAKCVDVTVNGLGERCGLSSMAELVTSLINLYKINRNWNLSLIPELTELVTEFSNFKFQDNQPLIGKNAFTHKSGLHVKAVLNNPYSYESINPSLLNRTRKFVIDKYTGVAAIFNKFCSLGISLSKQDVQIIMKHIKSRPDKVYWSDDELISIAKSIGIQV
tara:strand:+ start:4746 stop:5873 length:1128 start_codon:yes stop_codon:yes gene_type:complete